MSTRSRFCVVALVMTAALLAAIPVMATYGLNVCPVLLPLGFGFGCQYLALFALNVVLLNSLLLRGIFQRLPTGAEPAAAHDIRAAPRRGALAYLIAYGVTVIELMVWLHFRGLSMQSRGPEILGLLAALLAVLQYYGTAWAVLPAVGPDLKAAPVIATKRFWVRGAWRVIVPALISAAVAIHFVIRSAGLAHLLGASVPPPEPALGMIQMLVFLVIWQMAVMAFYAASEFDFGQRAARHLEAVGNQEYAHRSPVSGWGYWPRLFQAMNELSQGLLERSRLLQGFSSFVSRRVADDVLRQDVRFGGKREELTLLMADLRDFTTLAETLRPEDVVRLLNLYFYAMIEELGREGVTLDKFIGDGLLAYVDPDDPGMTPAETCARATRAALRMHERLKDVNRELAEIGLPQLRLGVGLTRGLLVRGNIGSRERMQYTVIGDSVNLVARLEGLCRDLGARIVVDRAVWQQLPPALQAQFPERGRFAVKGRTEAVHVHAS